VTKWLATAMKASHSHLALVEGPAGVTSNAAKGWPNGER
jgi:hypothetical protein